MNKLQEKQFKASKFFLIKNFKKLKYIYLINKDDQCYIEQFNKYIAQCKTKKEAQGYINCQYEYILENIQSIKEAYYYKENEEQEDI